MTAMDVNGLANLFGVLGAHWATPWLVGLLGLRALWTIIAWRRCPMSAAARAAEEDGEAAGTGAKGDASAEGEGAPQPAPARPPEAPTTTFTRMQDLRFGGVMLAGIALASWGLLRLGRDGADGAFAVLALVLGMYLFSTEPVRRSLDAAQRRVRQTMNTALHTDSVAMLRGAHVKLVAWEICIFALVLLGMTVA